MELANEGRAKAHFALWAIVKAPLMIGADLRYLQQRDLDIYKAEEVIAVNQDPLGVAGDLIFTQGSLQVCCLVDLALLHVPNLCGLAVLPGLALLQVCHSYLAVSYQAQCIPKDEAV
jgi:hypothetical protein